MAKRRKNHFTPEARDRRERLIGLNPWGGFNHNNLGCELFQMGHFAMAASEFQRAVEINPWKAHFKANLARALLALGEIERAQLMARKALEQEPRQPGALFAHALILENIGENKKAIAAYRACISAGPTIAIQRDIEENLKNLLQRIDKETGDDV